MRFLPLAALTVLLAAPAPAQNAEHRLNHVWSRMADLSGEFGSVESAEFSRDSRHIVTGTKYDNTVRLWRAEDGHLLWRTELPAEIERVAFTADGEHVVSVSEDRVLRVIQTSDGEVVREIEHPAAMDGLALSPDGRLMAVGEEMRGESRRLAGDGTALVTLYDTETWEPVMTVDQVTTANEIDFTPDGRRMVVVGFLNFRLWDVETGEQIAHHEVFYDTERKESSRFISVKASPDGRYLAVGSNRGWLYLFDAETGDYIRRVNDTGQKIETVEWTADSRYVLVSGKGNVIDFYATEYLADTDLDYADVPLALRVPVSDQLEFMDFDPSGALLTTAHQDGTVQLWTYMSDDPGLNSRSHRELRREQDRLFGAEGQ
ncbi:MAG: PQQ-binding-like beta-propeller repeat protein [Bacteroidota bacterium]